MPLTLASDAITFTNGTSLSSGIIGTAQLSAGSVTADKISNSSVTAEKLASNAISTQTISNSAITAEKMSGGQSGSAPVYGCRAWVNFNGTGTIGQPQTIRASGNVSHVIKNTTGDYTVVFTTQMPDVNYATLITQTLTETVNGAAFTFISTQSLSSVRIISFGNYPSGSASQSNTDLVCVAIIR